MRKKIELLAPARTAEIGIEAIRHGADAVYIGAESFGARQAAANSTDDISRLVDFAHQYGARVYVALNTVLTDDQLSEAEKLITKLYNIGVDALIVQDMGILSLNIPPIELHASTQTDVRDASKARFLEKAGFAQVVLARELSLAQIKDISSQVQARLEVFVHGALCVSYSGQCYISEALCGRSANRGNCAQYCRLPYDLLDADGKILRRGKHLLSMKDLNQSEYLEQLIDAGATSLKIEGRLKDVEYVKNITAYYRGRLDEIFRRRPELGAASSGHCQYTFKADPAKSFNRGFTNYYLNGRKEDGVVSLDTPKSIGEPVGLVKEVKAGSFTVAGLSALHNGDGLCFKNDRGEFEGFRINKVEDNRVYPLEMPSVKPKMQLYRNYDIEFEKLLSRDSSQRRIWVDITVKEVAEGFALDFEDEDGYQISYIIESDKQAAKTPQADNLKRQLAKLGNTIFEARNVNVCLTADYFIPASVFSEARRVAADMLLSKRNSEYHRNEVEVKPTEHNFGKHELTYLANVTNEKAMAFYQAHGVADVAWGFEVKKVPNATLMHTKHCIKYAMGWCRVFQKPEKTPKEPLYLVNKGQHLQLHFDCRNCEMKITALEK